MSRPAPRRRPLVAAATGLTFLPRGIATVARSGRLFVLGVIPPLVVGLVLLGLVIGLVLGGPDLVGALDPDAPTWARVLLALAAASAVAVVGVVVFSTITLAVGSPAYEAIAGLVDARLGAPDGPTRSRWWLSLASGLRDTAVLIMGSATLAVVCLLIGLVPVVGTVAAWVLSAVCGGWLVTLELTGAACERRGVVGVGQRHRLLAAQWWRVLPFSVPAFVVLSVPLLAVVVFPGAVAGATLLVRALHGPHGPHGPHGESEAGPSGGVSVDPSP